DGGLHVIGVDTGDTRGDLFTREGASLVGGLAQHMGGLVEGVALLLPELVCRALELLQLLLTRAGQCHDDLRCAARRPPILPRGAYETMGGCHFPPLSRRSTRPSATSRSTCSATTHPSRSTTSSASPPGPRNGSTRAAVRCRRSRSTTASSSTASSRTSCSRVVTRSGRASAVRATSSTTRSTPSSCSISPTCSPWPTPASRWAAAPTARSSSS